MRSVPLIPGDMEKNITALFKQGDKSGCALLYQYYGSAVFGVLTRMVKDQQLAEKYIVQVFCEIWDQRLNYDPVTGSLFPWILKIVKSCIAAQYIDTISREEINLIYATDIQAWLQEIKAEQGDNFAADIDETRKEALRLVYFESFSFVAAAEKLQLSSDALKLEIVKTIKQLKGSVLA